MIISPFTPLFFSPTTDEFGAKSKYVQVFAYTDRIFLELFLAKGEQVPECFINNLVTGISTPIVLSSWDMNDEKTVYFYTISLLPCGYYNVSISGTVSEIFKITDDERELSETTLIQYSMKDNKQRLDTVWWIDGMQYFFDFRVPGGFKDGGWAFGVDNEQFVTSDADIVELFSHEYTTQIFTLGNAIGCPVWFADLFNRILCCNYVYFDGARYARKESNVPELNQQVEGLKSFVFNQMLQKVKTISPVLEWNNQVSIRRIQGDTYRRAGVKERIRSVEFRKKPIEEMGPYVNMLVGSPITGVSINSDTKITIDSIHHPGEDTQTYWDLFTIKLADVNRKYIGRKGYGKIAVAGFDRLQDSLDDHGLSLRAILFTNNKACNLLDQIAIRSDGEYILKGIEPEDIDKFQEFQIYMDIYGGSADNIGMTIELTWMYNND